MTRFADVTQLPAPAPPQRHGPSRRTVLLIGAGVVVLALLVTYLVAFSPVFGARTVDVRGTRTVTAAQVRAAAHIEHGAPLVRLDTAAVARRVEAIPQIASAQVSTSFPSTVTITVTERTPVGYIRVGAKRDVLVDAAGAQYTTVAAPPAHLPRFVVPGGAVAMSTAVALGRVAGALTPALRSVVTSIQAFDPDSVTLTVTGGTLVRWGSAARSRDKARVLPILIKGRPGLVDVTDPDQPYVR